ncbi:C2 domain-containing family protein [Salix suchowensis]|nr:C2 domain-containing family protein [Salix suchowensis]
MTEGVQMPIVWLSTFRNGFAQEKSLTLSIQNGMSNTLGKFTYDPCTVITLGVFDNCHLEGGEKPTAANAARDSRTGKVRIRLSTLEAYRTYTHSYPLLVLHPHGVKKMGELQLAVRFTTLSLANMIYVFGHPLLPKMHYLHPFTVNQVDSLRYQAINIVAVRLGRAEPPLRKEVVEYMLDVDSHMWSMRSKANFFRHLPVEEPNYISVGSYPLSYIDLVSRIDPPNALSLSLSLSTCSSYKFRLRHPPHMDTKLSWAEEVHPDELDEEFDTFPTSKSHDIVRMRKDPNCSGRHSNTGGEISVFAQLERS